MIGRILVVDDTAANVRILSKILQAELFAIDTAACGEEALERISADPPDLVLLDVMMPGIDGYETCRRIKADARMRRIPVVMVTALSEAEDRIRGLEAGADDFLSKPIDRTAMLARIKHLLRAAQIDALRRDDPDGAIDPADESPTGGRVLVRAASPDVEATLLHHLARDAHIPAPAAQADIAVIDLGAEGTPPAEGLRAAAAMRTAPETRDLSLVVLLPSMRSDPEARILLERALDLGIADYLHAPLDPVELRVRLRAALRRRRAARRAQAARTAAAALATTDPLTDLPNRRAAERRLDELACDALRTGVSHGLVLLDIDHFKAINDKHGHDVGDEVLRIVGARMACALRPSDLLARWGGEEFVVAVRAPAGCDGLYAIANRLRRIIADTPVILASGLQVPVTISLGVALLPPGRLVSDAYRAADIALYAAKAAGRNQTRISETDR
jgi:two-component system cell cycle response regulator